VDAQLLKSLAAVIKKADREHPADSMLRNEFRTAKIPRRDAGDASRALFAYYRWRGWLAPDRPLNEQIDFALELAENWAAKPKSFADEKLIELCVPMWTHNEMQVSAAWVRAIQSEPKLWLRAKRGAGRELAERLGECWSPPQPALADAIEYEGEEDLFRTPEFQAGEFEVQDLNSQAVSLLCNPQPGETWWDTCAGEGGKLLHLSDLMQNKGLIWASDRADWRLKKLKLRAGRAKCFNYRAVLWDGGAKLPTKTKFNGVLVDAPCSGVGTWQRNPHARWTTTADDVHELSDVQRHLLSNVASSVKPGGKLIYSVCTLTQAETSGVADEFAKAHPEFQPLALPDLATRHETSRGLSTSTTNQKWLWPQDTGGNGMFIAAWQRSA
jgi:16S rRNA (cytosine967-C5)-methyltransferase